MSDPICVWCDAPIPLEDRVQITGIASEKYICLRCRARIEAATAREAGQPS